MPSSGNLPYCDYVAPMSAEKAAAAIVPSPRRAIGTPEASQHRGDVLFVMLRDGTVIKPITLSPRDRT